MNCQRQVILILTKVYLNTMHVFEFKLKGTAAAALKQIDSREYLTPWKGKGKKLYKIGVSFDQKKRKIKEYIIKT